MFWVLILIGILIISFLHLIIPVCVASSGKAYKISTLWAIALAGGLFGFIVCAIMQEEFRGMAGVIQSAFWSVVGFFILKKRCGKREEKKEEKPVETVTSKEVFSHPVLFCRECGEKLLSDSVFCYKCGTKVLTVTETKGE